MSQADKIARHVAEIPRSGIREFFELVIGRSDVISLGVGEPDFSAPWHIREAAIYSLERGETSYTSNLGLQKLRDAIADYVRGHFKVSYSPKDEVLVTVGVSEALDLAFRALLNPGDEVIFHEPCYVSYHPGIVLAFGKPVSIQTRPEDEFALLAADVERAITPKTRAIVLNFPTNPTGAIEPVEELEKIAALCVKHDLIAISDEIYSELVYDGKRHVSIASLPGMRERTILLHGFSKAFAMTGFRLGYACAPPELTGAMMKIHQYSMLCAPITSQVAATEALRGSLEPVEKMRAEYHRRRNMIVGRFNAMGLPCHMPGGAFYAFPDIRPSGLSSKDFAGGLLESQSVAAVPGDAFGAAGDGFLRCCYAADPKLIAKALDGFEVFLKSL
ncbi:MAG: aminotransferase class I/II-fold pyridoxal phosphate-dependent enzyme [Verrucomicrobiales bacterium]